MHHKPSKCYTNYTLLDNLPNTKYSKTQHNSIFNINTIAKRLPEY
ncbi:hypothetical protein APHCR_1489 [Anaplasma phagocytophilum str. CR1007]|nr:hypothetical protein APHCR_1489 [Anaplasma phagocytophilum str. CR1007]